jgi:hypothetical protein
MLQLDKFSVVANDVCSMNANGYFHMLVGD